MKYDYTDNGRDDAVVDTASPDFLRRIQYVMENGPMLKEYILSPYVTGSIGVANGNPIPGSEYAFMRVNVDFTDDENQAVAMDAWLLFDKPDTALKTVYGMLNKPSPVPFPQFADFGLDVSQDPIGAPWPEHGSRVYHVSPAFSEDKYPLGTYHTKRLDGRDVNFYRTKVRVSGGTGPFGFGFVSAPAWIWVE